jgi:hypothetical protein
MSIHCLRHNRSYAAGLSILESSSFRLCLVTETLLGCTSDNRGGAEYGRSLTVIYTPFTVFNLPSAVAVKMGDATLTPGTDYTWNQTSGELYILSVTDAIDITVTCTLDGTLYTQCSYIQSSGNQWINTGITGSGTTKVLIDFSIVSNPSGWWGLFGACVANINRSLLVGINNLSTITIQNGTNVYQDVAYSFALNSRYTVYLNPPYTYVNDVLKSTKTPGSYTTPVPVALFWQNYSSSTSMAKARIKLYSCKMWNGDNLVRYFVPAVRNEDGVPGLYDIVSGTFFVNAGTGSFTYE